MIFTSTNKFLPGNQVGIIHRSGGKSIIPMSSLDTSLKINMVDHGRLWPIKCLNYLQYIFKFSSMVLLFPFFGQSESLLRSR